jgi:hypothetical protein
MQILGLVASYMFLLGEENISAKEFAIRIKNQYSLENTHNLNIYNYLINLEEFYGKRIFFNKHTITIETETENKN